MLARLCNLDISNARTANVFGLGDNTITDSGERVSWFLVVK